MTFTLSGDFDQSVEFASLRIGVNGVGNGSITDGTAVEIDSNPNFEAFLALGRFAGSSGTLTVSGDDSTLRLNGSGSQTSAATAHVGRVGQGTLNLLDGGSLEIIDDVGNSNINENSVSMTLGRDAGSSGSLFMDRGELTVRGDGAFMFIGRSGGAGSAVVENGSTVTIEDTTSLDAGLTLGRDGTGTSTLLVLNSSIDIRSANGGAFLHVGREATGNASMTVGAGASIDLTGTAFASMLVARDAGTNGSIIVTDGGSIMATSNDVSMIIASNLGSTGAVDVTNGGSIDLTGNADSDLLVGAAFEDFGRSASGQGSLLISGATSVVAVDDNVIIGAPEGFGGGAGDGSVVLENGGVVRADGGGVFVGTGGTLAGDGSIDGNLIVDGGVVLPGASAGQLSVFGDLELLDGELNVEFGGTLPGESDLISVDGDVLLDGGLIRLSFLAGSGLSAGQSFDFLTSVGTVQITDSTSVAIDGVATGFDASLSETGGAVSLVATNSSSPGSGTVFLGGSDGDEHAGTASDDALFGGLGNDTLVGLGGADVLNGGLGDDTVDYSASDGAVTVFLGSFATGGDSTGDSLLSIENVTASPFDDVLFGDVEDNVFTGGFGRDYLSGAAGNDTLFGGGDADVLESGAGNDTLDGGAGQDLLSAFDATSDVVIDLGNLTNSSADYAGDVLISIEGILGAGAFANTLSGTGADDLFIGGNQADALTGGDGANVLLGQGGDDTIVGGVDGDVLLTGFGDDTVTTGAGTDRILFALNDNSGEGDDLITDFELGVDLLIFYGTGFSDEDVSVGTASGSTNALLRYASSSVELDGITEADVNSSFVFVEV